MDIRIEKEIFKFINDNLPEGRKVIENKPKEKSFEECYNQLDYDIQCRFDYIHKELCSVSDEMLEIVDEIEKLKVEMEIEKIINGKRANTECLDCELKGLQDEMNYLNTRYEVLMDLHDDMYLKILM